MAKENKKEVSFVEGPIFQSLIRFALPVLGALILQAAYGAVDLLVVGWFGDASSISAVGTGSSFMQMVTFIITSLAMGSTVMIGQHIGEGKPDKAGKTVGTSIVLFAIIGVAMTVILELFAGPIANILQVPAESFDKTVLYLRICSGGILIIIAYNVILTLGMRLLYFKGYELGGKAVEMIVGEKANAIRESIIMLGTVVIGAVAASWISITTPLVLPGDISLQKDVLDTIFPKMLPLGTVMLCYWLMSKKKMAPTTVMLVLVGIALVGVLIGFFDPQLAY